MNKRLLVLSVGAVLSASSLAQTTYRSSYTGPKVELTFWNGQSGDNRVYLEDLVKKFNAQHPNIIVKMTTQDAAAIAQQLPGLVAAGRAPDAASLIETQTISTGVRGALTELTPELLRSAKIDAKRFYPSVWAGSVYEGRVYGVPAYNVSYALFYNKDLLKKSGVTKVPTTRGEFLRAATACTVDKAGKKPGEAGFTPNNLATWGVGVQSGFFGATFAYSVLLQNGGNTVDARYNPRFSSQQAIDAVQFTTDLVKKYNVSPAKFTYDAELAAFRAGQQCFSVGGTWLYSNFQSQKGLNFGVTSLPQLGGATRAFWGGSGYFVLPRQRPTYDRNKRAAALELVNWLSLPENNAYFAAKGGTLPTGPGAAKDANFANSPFEDLFKDLANVRIEAGWPWVDQVRGAWVNAWDSALSGKKATAAALRDGETEATKQVDSAKKNLR